METVFVSKIDGWLLAILGCSALASIFACVQVVAATPSMWLIGIFIGLTGAGLPLWLLLGTRYTLGTATLKVQSGPFRWTVPLKEVTGVTPTRNPLSSPALSLDRLRIEYGKGRVLMLSPRDKQLFLRTLEERRAALA